MDRITKAYEAAKEIYSSYGVNVEAALERLDTIPVSMHCWQGDDVVGFENFGGGLTGGIQTTGNYPGRATTPAMLRADLDKALSLIPGTTKVNIHASYLETDGKPVDRDAIEPKHYENWIQWACDKGIGLDFNPTFFSHKKENGYTLASSDPAIREFWIEHAIRSRIVAEEIGRRTGKLCINNLWIPDGSKDNPVSRLAPRQRLVDSLDRIYAAKLDPSLMRDAFESKLFGIGSESYVVGSHEFCLSYALTHGIVPTYDAGHYHPTEVVSNKISATLLFSPELLLHVSRPVRWDSDHVVTMDDELMAIMQEIVRGDFTERVFIALDYFDASINRIAAWVIGMRNTRKALLRALTEPYSLLREDDPTSILALGEEFKALPWSALWDYYCVTHDMPAGADWLPVVKAYEKDVLSKR